MTKEEGISPHEAIKPSFCDFEVDVTNFLGQIFNLSDG